MADDSVHAKHSDSIFRCSNNNSPHRFEKFLTEFLSEVGGFKRHLPFPPMLGYGRPVNLYKLFLVVRGNGGYDTVCNGNLWNTVGEKSGLGVNVGSSVKLVYTKYLSALDARLKKVAESKVSSECGVVDDRDKFGRRLMELHAKVEGLLLSGGEKCGDNYDKSLELDPSSGDNDDQKGKRDMFNCKTMKESVLDMLSWVTGAAKNPCDPELGSMPGKSMWKSCSNQEVWKQVLLFRDATFLKRGSDLSREQRYWQSQKMHPSLYEDQLRTNYNIKKRLKGGKKIDKSKSSDSSVGTKNRAPQGPHNRSKKRLLDSSDHHAYPLGVNHQVEILEWIGVISEGYSKFSGTQIWPPATENTKLLIESDPIGKGREDSCNCLVPSSVECVRFHINEKRIKLHVELGAAFYDWNFDKVGEDVRLLWTKEEEKKFEDAIQSNPSSSKTYFWDSIFKAFPKKSRVDLVSYYFNVFMLERRGFQNRHTPDNINSDDDNYETKPPLRNVFGHQTTHNSRHRKK